MRLLLQNYLNEHPVPYLAGLNFNDRKLHWTINPAQTYLH
jgi:hypothetical protein